MAAKLNIPFSKLKFKIAKRPDSGELENNVDVREDSEQALKLQEIIDILVTAGYFRARIKNLSSFDKVVGGMVWCIEFCNAEVDVDLLFQENSTIGQKIALTEKIVAVLPQIQCPYLIEPHQIQGLDFIHICPVIQWLVKRSMEFRKEASNSCYSFAVNQFEKYFAEPSDLTAKQKQILQNIKSINDVYKPHRMRKKKNILPVTDILSRVNLTLMEYGYSPFPKPNEDENAHSQETSRDIVQNINQMLKYLDTTMEEYNDSATMDSEKMAEHYRQLNIELKVPELLGPRNLNALKTVSDRLDYTLEGAVKCLEGLREDSKIMKSSITKIKLEKAELVNAIRNLESDGINSDNTKEVELLLLERENLDKRKGKFEEACQEELNLLKSSIKSLEDKSVSASDKYEGLDTRIAEGEEKLNSLRLRVAKTNREVSILLRKIDEVPSRSELAQYQKRFIELYNEISAKYKETKQYYTLYNTLESTRQYMRKEVSLLNSVIDNFPAAIHSKEAMDEFLQQLSNILEGVRKNKHTLESRHSLEKRKRDALSDELHGHHEMNRKYATAIKVLKAEFQKNEDILKNTA